VAAERIRNRVLRQLASSEPSVYAQLADQMEPTALERGVVLGAPRARAEFVYFVESGIVSLVAVTRSGHSVEVAIVGREGVAGIADALGEHPLPYRLVVQSSGLAYRVPVRVIRDHILTCSALHQLLMGYSQSVMHQLAQSAVCNRFHSSVQRLARWLLLTSNRAETNQLVATHEIVAQMVGAPRSAVTQSAAAMRRRGIIDYRRGVFTIKSTARLQTMACECFDVIMRGTDDFADA
jgi:CRP-like cAMP-binding protein